MLSQAFVIAQHSLSPVAVRSYTPGACVSNTLSLQVLLDGNFLHAMTQLKCGSAWITMSCAEDGMIVLRFMKAPCSSHFCGCECFFSRADFPPDRTAVEVTWCVARKHFRSHHFHMHQTWISCIPYLFYFMLVSWIILMRSYSIWSLPEFAMYFHRMAIIRSQLSAVRWKSGLPTLIQPLKFMGLIYHRLSSRYGSQTPLILFTDMGIS